MTFLTQLWLPILLSAVAVFVLSAASHMVLPWRRGEYKRITAFDPLQSALKKLGPGLYSFPSAPTPREQMSPEWLKRWAEGPSGWLTVAPRGPMSMGRSMAQSFLAFLAVSFMTAYVAAHSLGAAPHYLTVFRVVGTIGFLTYGVSPIFNSIWYSRPWRAYLSDVLDALLFCLTMAGVFGWLWPR
jgi:hypothetical protein